MSLRAFLSGLTTAVLAAGLGLMAFAAPANAQEIGQEALDYLGTFAFADSLRTWDQAKEFNAETVLDHNRDGFVPTGYRLPAGHVLYPSIEAKTIYDDNIFRDVKKVADLRSSVAGNIELQTNLPRHMFKLLADGEFVDFKDHPNLNFANGNVRGDWRLDIDAADSIGGSFQSEYRHDDNFLPIEPDNTSKPVPIWVNRSAIGYMHDAGRTAVAFGADYQRTLLYNVPTYGGAHAEESATSNDIAGAFALASYRWSPGYRLFVAARVDRQMALHEQLAYSNNNTYRTEAGVSYELDPLLQFTLFGGYEYVKFDSDTQYNFGTTTLKGSMQWLPTRRLTVRLDGGRQVQRTVVGPEFGQITDSIHGRAQYDIYHNIVGTLDLSMQRSQFIGNSRVDNQWNAGVSLDYRFNENLALTLGYEHTDRASTDSKFTYDDNRFMATLKLSQ